MVSNLSYTYGMEVRVLSKELTLFFCLFVLAVFLSTIFWSYFLVDDGLFSLL